MFNLQIFAYDTSGIYKAVGNASPMERPLELRGTIPAPGAGTPSRRNETRHRVDRIPFVARRLCRHPAEAP